MQENKDYTEQNDEIHKDDQKKNKGCLKAVLIFFLLIAGLVLWFVYEVNHSYTHFTKRRIAEMEDRFNITVTDDITLKKYSYSWHGQGGSDHVLYIEDIKDYHDFMENNVSGTVYLLIENGVMYDYRKNTESEYEMTDFIAYYEYKYSKKGYHTDAVYEYYRSVWFYKQEDGSYSAVLSNIPLL